jgi:hypothetical protein
MQLHGQKECGCAEPQDDDHAANLRLFDPVAHTARSLLNCSLLNCSLLNCSLLTAQLRSQSEALRTVCSAVR